MIVDISTQASIRVDASHYVFRLGSTADVPWSWSYVILSIANCVYITLLAILFLLGCVQQVAAVLALEAHFDVEVLFSNEAFT